VQLEHTFTVPADVETVWQAVLDPERVAPCMPGATLTEVEGQSFSGTVKVKMGPISLLYKGSGEFLETDEAARRVVIKASGKDSRGNGTAAATVTVTLRPDGESTTGEVHTDLSVTGKPAQFGRGMISEVSGKILDSFATSLASKLAPESGEPVPEPEPPKLSVVESSDESTASNGKSADEPNRNPPGNAKPAGPKLAPVAPPEPEPIDLLSVAGPSVMKRAAPLLVLLFVVLVVVALRRRSR
jgi:carbon monoxide dehydrogenase subunit G